VPDTNGRGRGLKQAPVRGYGTARCYRGDIIIRIRKSRNAKAGQYLSCFAAFLTGLLGSEIKVIKMQEFVSKTLDFQKFVTPDGLAWEDYSEERQLIIARSVWAENKDELYELYTDIKGTNASKDQENVLFRALYTLLNNLKKSLDNQDEKSEESNYIKDNAETLVRVLPLLFRSPELIEEVLLELDSTEDDISYSAASITEIQRKVIKDTIELQDAYSCISAYISYTAKEMNRGTKKEEYPIDYADYDEWKTEVEKEISQLYGILAFNYKISGIEKIMGPEVRDKISSTLSMNPWRFPIQASLFSIDAVELMNNRKVVKRAELLFPKNDRLPEYPAKEKLQYYLGLKLLSSCEDTVARTIESSYEAIPYPDKVIKNRSPLFLTDEEDESDIAEKEYYNRIQFALPICKIRKLIQRISGCCILSIKMENNLREELPVILYSPSNKKTYITGKYGSAVAEIVEVFWQLCKPVFYNTIDEKKSKIMSIDEFIVKLKKTMRPLYRMGFIDYDPTKTDYNEGRFLCNYFSYISVGKLVFSLGVSLLPDFNCEVPLMETFKSLRKKFYKNLKKYRSSETDNYLFSLKLSDDAKTFMTKRRRRLISERLTYTHILDFIDCCLIPSTSSSSQLRKRLQSLLSKEEWKEIEKIISLAPDGFSKGDIGRRAEDVFVVLYKEVAKVLSDLFVWVYWRSMLYVYLDIGTCSRRIDKFSGREPSTDENYGRSENEIPLA